MHSIEVFGAINPVWDDEPEPHMGKCRDDIQNPKHYTHFSVECIDMMRAIYGDRATAIYCELAAFKYHIRAGQKDDPLKDLAKAEWYRAKRDELGGIK